MLLSYWSLSSSRGLYRERVMLFTNKSPLKTYSLIMFNYKVKCEKLFELLIIKKHFFISMCMRKKALQFSREVQRNMCLLRQSSRHWSRMYVCMYVCPYYWVGPNALFLLAYMKMKSLLSLVAIAQQVYVLVRNALHSIKGPFNLAVFYCTRNAMIDYPSARPASSSFLKILT